MTGLVIRVLVLMFAPCWALAGEVVLDAETGAVLAGADHDAPRRPASVTKLMTIYTALEAVRAGEIGLEDEVVISARAAAAPPVRLGLKAGETVRLSTLLHAALECRGYQSRKLSSGERKRLYSAFLGDALQMAEGLANQQPPQEHLLQAELEELKFFSVPEPSVAAQAS